MRILHLTKLSLLIGGFSVLGFGQTNGEKPNGLEVLLNVSVVGERNAPIRDLKVENFRVFENKKPVEISHFNNVDSPLSIGFLIDASQSMESRVDMSREAVLTFLEESNPQNEYFVTAFRTGVDILSGFTNFDETTKIISASPYFAERKKKGDTALYEAMIYGIETLSKAKNRKRILFVFWDANEDYKSPKYKEVEKLVKEKNITVFLFGFNPVHPWAAMKDLADISGGSFAEPGSAQFAVIDPKILTVREEILRGFSNLAKQLKNQYTIGFKPDSDGDKNKWRKLEVKLKIQKELRKKIGFPSVRFRQGYYPFSEMVTSN